MCHTLWLHTLYTHTVYTCCCIQHTCCCIQHTRCCKHPTAYSLPDAPNPQKSNLFLRLTVLLLSRRLSRIQPRLYLHNLPMKPNSRFASQFSIQNLHSSWSSTPVDSPHLIKNKITNSLSFFLFRRFSSTLLWYFGNSVNLNLISSSFSSVPPSSRFLPPPPPLPLLPSSHQHPYSRIL